MRKNVVRYALILAVVLVAAMQLTTMLPRSLAVSSPSGTALSASGLPARMGDVQALLADTSTNTATATGTSTDTATTTATGSATSTGTVTATPTASGTVTLVPTMFLSTPSGPPGSNVTITGSGFTPNSPILFTVGGQNVIPTGGQVTATPFGSFGATIVVPSSIALGPTVITASDSHAQQVQVQFSVSAGSLTATATTTATPLTSTPGAGPPGTTVTLSAPLGTFPAGALASVLFRDATAGNPSTPLAGGNVQGDGSLSLVVTIPSQATTGAATIAVTAGSVTLNATFTVQPAISPAPSAAQSGTALQLIGNGFAANRAITFSVGGQAVSSTTGTVTSSSLGSFTATLTVPATLPQGQVTISASDGLSGASAPFSVTTGGATATSTPVTNLGATVTPTSGIVPFPTIVVSTPIPATATSIPVAGKTASPAPTAARPGKTVTTAYFAEGYTGQARTNGKVTFSESLNILNPGSATASVTFTYFVQGTAKPLSLVRTVAAHTVMRESVNADVGAEKVVAAMVTSPQVIGVTRTIDRVAASGARLDGSSTLSMAAPARNWGFPEGYTGNTFQEYLTLLNPSGTPAHVTVRLAPQASSDDGARVLHLVVPKQSRSTADISALNRGARAASVGMLISSDQPVVAERVEYFGDGAGSAKFGSTVSAGIGASTKDLRIAYGSAGGASRHGTALQPVGDQAYVTVLNPSLSGTPVVVTVSLTDNKGKGLAPAAVIRVAPGTRQTVSANPQIGTHAAGPFSIAVDATGPIQAEAAQYFGGSPNAGRHPGVAFAALTNATIHALMSALATRQADGTAVQQRLYLYNPYSAAIRVAVTYYGSNYASAQGVYAVQASGITTVDVGSVTRGLPPGPIGASLTLASGSGGFVAVAVGRTADGQSAIEDVGVPAP